jgi:cyclopropane-fatty-acyl-phospholipid synthase
LLSSADSGESPLADRDVAKRILSRLLEGYPISLAVSLWNGRILRFGSGTPAFVMTIRHPCVLRDLVLFRDPIRLAEAYFNGDIEVAGDFEAAIGLRRHLENMQLSLSEKFRLGVSALALGGVRLTDLLDRSREPVRARENGKDTVSFHYDISNDFYRLWLDPLMVYSCAYFEHAEQSLEQAQCNKLEHICRKLRLQEGESLIDIGCGWGALVCWAARHYGVHAHGITLSEQQYEYACAEVRRQRLERLVRIELLDYRHLPDDRRYDKAVSVGMFEHVGLQNLPTYFATVRRVLKPGGLFLNHGIATETPGWNADTSARFINRHVFPDGELDTLGNVLCRMEEGAFEIFDVEGLRPHYALTLRHWVRRLEAHAEEAARIAGERTYRVWRLYMAGCAEQFMRGTTGIYQILAVGRHEGLPALPLTRRDLYQRALPTVKPGKLPDNVYSISARKPRLRHPDESKP